MSDFFKSKFDNLSLYSLILILVGVLVWADLHGSDKLTSWIEQTTTTVLGAYIGLTQAHRLAWNKPNGGTNSVPAPTPVLGPEGGPGTTTKT